MSKAKHPGSRAERRRIKKKKDRHSFERQEAISRQFQFEALEQKEALDDLRKQVLQTEEEERPNDWGSSGARASCDWGSPSGSVNNQRRRRC